MGRKVRIPEKYTATPPMLTVCLVPPQVGALLSNLSMPRWGLTYAHTSPPHTLPTHMCTMQARCRAPDLQAPV